MADRNVGRVALCDDHGIVRGGLRRIIDAEDDLEVVGEAGSVHDAVALAIAERPHVFVMDLGLPDGSGITATAEVRRVSPSTRVLVLTVHDDVAYLRCALDAVRRAHIHQKLDVRTRAELVRIAREAGALEAEGQ